MTVPKLSQALLVLVGTLAGCATGKAYEAPTTLEMKNLAKISLSEEFTPGREIVVSLVEIPPNTTMDRHWHPGEEFHYYLEGDMEIRIDGQPPFEGTPGTVGHVPFKKMHTAVTGPRGGRALVFRVHTAGEPVRFLEKGGESER